jgi:ATP-dependent RNA circularization protein (DNA/RNA ligase family)
MNIRVWKKRAKKFHGKNNVRVFTLNGNTYAKTRVSKYTPWIIWQLNKD